MDEASAGADPNPAPYDVIGVGFGPSNLALAVALAEHGGHRDGGPLRAVFLERRPSFGWHPGMLIEDATMQVSFLKDLATMRNPVSSYGFLTYLQERGRLVDFINHKEFFPSRVEFHDYLEWAAARFTDLVEYRTEAVAVRPVLRGDEVVAFDVVSRGPAGEHTRRTRNLVVASGLVPQLPPGVERSERVWHSAELLDRLPGLEGTGPRSFAVVGAGQSAAEVAGHLHGRFPDAAVHAVVPRYGYSPADDSPFANRIFDPDAVDAFFGAAPSVKEKFFEYHANTNYSVVDLDVINDLYRRSYQESVRGERRLHVHNMSRVTSLGRGPDGRPRLEVEYLPDGRGTSLDVDVAVFATGYRQMDPAPLLGPVADLCKRDSNGRLRVGRDYRVETGADTSAGLYLQGGTEHTHGISSSLLSNLAVRAWEIVESITAAPRPAAEAPDDEPIRSSAHVRS
ncbi:lysine N(6)-hydroxylase/L-ornithine N(5)-oxygenase family protein [Kitasatospora purpeofusca]|uniref:L-lysine N6-monooxygenase MbtG n=1 Tax=Kitasatospora purpeofusca TaxID=67352 RepID=A0ABZ1U5V3_9ACTN|nr:lysine N(6)-hydroxylase/L-ornithine N(5)-oxygenase family protein [Kitasatospora purpeofusca]